jgi:predicted transcriptional regulator
LVLPGSGRIAEERQTMKRVTIHTDGFEGARKRSLERARKLDRGETLEPETSITLDASSLKLFTPARLQVLKTLRDKEISITSLAELLKRPREAVSRDVKALNSIGIVKVKDVTNPGHGRVTMVSLVARRVLLEV